MDDRRKEMRKKLMAFSPVYDKERGNVLGYLADLTLQGAKVVGEKPLELHSRITLAIDLPGDLPGISAKHMNIPAQVARCMQDEDGPREFDLGFEFTGINPEQTQIIQALLERYHFRYQPEE
jgi:hypothetical protein